MQQQQQEQTWTVRRLLEWTSGFFSRKNVDPPRLSAELLLAHVLNVPRIKLYTDYERPLTDAQLTQFRELVRCGGEHEPIAYLTGKAHFFNLEFEVNSDVLIPRPDTETIVENVLQQARHASGMQSPRVLELCSGSGCVAAAIAHHLKTCTVVATELSAAAVALGRIGNAEAARALKRSLPGTPDAVRSAVAQGCILCAEQLLARGRNAEAVKLYDTVRRASVPKQSRLEATRGAILARKMDGLPLLLEQLRSMDKGELSIGLSTARELPGLAVTKALAAEIHRQRPERQSFLLLALADRPDAAVMPAVVEAARSGPPGLRLTAVGALERISNAAAVPVLLEAAAQGEPELSQKSLTALARLPGNEIDNDILARLPASSGKMRQALVDVAGRRRIEGAMPALVQSAEDPDAGVRSAAVQAIGALGEAPQAADLVRLLGKTQNSKERADLEAALIAISGRTGTRCVPNLLALARSNESALRLIALQALAAAGGPEALAAVVTAVQEQDESVQDEAVRTLSTWPNNWPDDTGAAEPLLALAKSGKKSSHQVLGLRGYLQYLQSNKKLSNDEKVSKINELLPLPQRPEEKRLAIGVIDTIPTAGVLELLTTFAAEPALVDDACSAIVKLATGKMPGVSAEQRQKALQTVVEKSENDTTKKKAADLLKASS